MTQVRITSSGGRGHRKHEWVVTVDDPEDFAMSLGLFLIDNYGWGK